MQEWCISLHWIALWAPCSGILSQIICNHVDSLPSNDRIVIVVVDDLGSFHAINGIVVLSYPVQWVFYSERVCSASEFHHQTCTWIHTQRSLIRNTDAQKLHEQLAWKSEGETKVPNGMNRCLFWFHETFKPNQTCIHAVHCCSVQIPCIGHCSTMAVRSIKWTHTHTSPTHRRNIRNIEILNWVRESERKTSILAFEIPTISAHQQ